MFRLTYSIPVAVGWSKPPPISSRRDRISTRSAIVHDRKLTCDAKRGQIPSGRYKCFVPFLAHDAVHPSTVGHAIAKDLIVHALALAERRSCKEKGSATMVQRDAMPLTTFVAEDVRQLEVRSQYLIVRDMARIFLRWDKLVPMPGSSGGSSSGTVGFELYADDELKQRPGWIATNPLGKSTITFSIELPYEKEGYAVYLVILRSYKGMGTFRAEVRDYGDDSNKEKPPKKITTKDIDGLWASPISVWSDVQVTGDDDPGCTGYCEVTVITNPKVNGRDGNKVKCKF